MSSITPTKTPTDGNAVANSFPNIHTVLIWLVGSIFISASIAQTDYSRIGYFMAIFFYVLLIGWIFVADGTVKIYAAKPAILFLFPIYFMYLYHLLFSAVGASGLIRALVFISASVINILIIVNYVSIYHFFYLASRLSAAITIVGIPSFLLKLTPQDFSQVYLWPYIFATSSSSTPIPPFSSYFITPNGLGTVLLIGTISTLILASQKRSMINYLIFVIVLFGLFLTQSRGAYAGFASSIVIYIIYFGGGVMLYRIAIPSVLAAVAILFFALAEIVSLPVSSIELSRRNIMWQEGIEMIKNRPLTGYGPLVTSEIMTGPHIDQEVEGRSVHSTFVRMFLTTGIVGGIGYIFFSLWAVNRRIGFHRNPLLIPLGVGLIVAQVFNEFSMFGLGLSSVLTAMVFGYLTSTE